MTATSASPQTSIASFRTSRSLLAFTCLLRKVDCLFWNGVDDFLANLSVVVLREADDLELVLDIVGVEVVEEVLKPYVTAFVCGMLVECCGSFGELYPSKPWVEIVDVATVSVGLAVVISMRLVVAK